MRKRGSLVLLTFLSSACATYPKMDDASPLKVQRGYWISQTSFEQRGRTVDRGSVKKALSKQEESADAVRRGAAFDIFAVITAVGSGTCLGLGLARTANKKPGDEQSTTTALLLSGAGLLGLSITFGLGADGAYVSAVDAYNGSRFSEPSPREP